MTPKGYLNLQNYAYTGLKKNYFVNTYLSIISLLKETIQITNTLTIQEFKLGKLVTVKKHYHIKNQN